MTITRAEVKANREKFAAFLQEPERMKVVGTLEDLHSPDRRCCLGHGCHLFGLTRTTRGDCVYFDNERSYAPRKLQNLLGMWNQTGSSRNDTPLTSGGYSSLAALNDLTAMTPQDIGAYVAIAIEGGENTPFKPLSIYQE